MTDQSADLVFLDPASGLEIRDLSPTQDGDAAMIITSIPRTASIDDARAAIASIREASGTALFGAQLGRSLVGVFALRRDGLANDLAFIAVHEDHRRRGIGRTMLQDALRRTGKRPLALQTPETVLGFFKTCGFKLVGRRMQSDGSVEFRLGWHTPGAHFKGGTTSALTHQPLASQDHSPTGEPTS